MNQMKLLGLMTHRIIRPSSFSRYRKTAIKEGFDDLVLFTPFDVHLHSKRITGHKLREGHWQRILTPFPAIAHDIGYYGKPSTIAKVKQIKNTSPLPFISYSLGSKWTIQKHLMESPQLSPYLLPTRPFADVKSLLNMVEEHGTVMIKPLNGKGGKGILKLSRVGRHYRLRLSIHGTERTRICGYDTICAVLRKLRKQGKYIVQQWIDIRCPEGQVYDIRALVQKNDAGEWQLSAMGIRRGAKAKITSNITGGGTAHHVIPFLLKQFGEEETGRIHSILNEIAAYLPAYLEQSYRSRFAELGLDLAVDRAGHVWIIEVNIKPGKTIVAKLYGTKAANASFRAPIRYAKYVLDNKVESELFTVEESPEFPELACKALYTS